MTSKSPILAINEVAENQNNRYLTLNAAIEALEASANLPYNNSGVGAGPVTLTEAQFTGNFVFRLSGGSGNFELHTPTAINTLTPYRVFAVRNEDGSHTCLVKVGTGAGASVTLAASTSAILLQINQDIYLLASIVAGGVTNPYDLSTCYLSTLPSANTVLTKIIFDRTVTFAGNLAGSYGHCTANPAGNIAIDFQKNGSSTGTISVNTSGVFTFATTAGAAVVFAAGDLLTLVGPSPNDTNISDISLTFAGIR